MRNEFSEPHVDRVLRHDNAGCHLGNVVGHELDIVVEHGADATARHDAGYEAWPPRVKLLQAAGRIRTSVAKAHCAVDGPSTEEFAISREEGRRDLLRFQGHKESTRLIRRECGIGSTSTINGREPRLRPQTPVECSGCDHEMATRKGRSNGKRMSKALGSC